MTPEDQQPSTFALQRIFAWLLSSGLSVFDSLRKMMKGLLMLIAGSVLGKKLKSGDNQEIGKIPKHIGLCTECADENEASKLGKIVTWCLGQGILTVTVYEASGFLHAPQAFKAIKDELETVIQTNDKIDTLDIYVSGVRTTQLSKPNKQPKKAAENDTPPAQVRILAASDGHQDVINVVRQLAEEKEVAIDDISEELIRKKLKATAGTNQKLQLLLAMPDFSALAHFPPELLRNAEIMKGPAVAKMDHDEFLKMLRGYANVQQRWGR